MNKMKKIKQTHFPRNNCDEMFVTSTVEFPTEDTIIILKDGKNIIKNDFTIDYVLSNFSKKNKEKYYKELEQALKKGNPEIYLTNLMIRNYIIEEQRKPLVIFTKTFKHRNFGIQKIDNANVPTVTMYSLLLSATNNGYLNVVTRITASPKKESFETSYANEMTIPNFYFDARKKYESKTFDKSLDFIIRYNFDDLLYHSKKTARLKNSINKIEASNALLECLHAPKIFFESYLEDSSDNPLTEQEKAQLEIMNKFAYRECLYNRRYSSEEIRAYLRLSELQKTDFSYYCNVLGIKEVPKIDFKIPENVKFSKYLESMI